MTSVRISEWLQKLGLGRYSPLFREHEIDYEMLPALTENDLVEIGLPLGPRRIILANINNVYDARATATQVFRAERPASSSDIVADSYLTEAAERRRIAIAFFDMVGSTPLAVRLDPEELRDVTRRFLSAVRASIDRYGGYVARYMGDGALAFFGWPEAFEDQAERAVRAALDGVSAVHALEFESDLRLDVRIGIATGLVVVGDDGVDLVDVSGDAPNRAQRLQSLATPGQIVIDHATRAACGSSIETTSLGIVSAKGFPEPFEVWAATGIGNLEHRGGASGDVLTPFVGREHEFGILVDRWESARRSEGQLMLLSGEPGIGKSRLVRTLQSHLRGEPHTLVRLQCIDYHADSAFYPIAQFFRHLAQIRADDDDAEQRRKIETSAATAFGATSYEIVLIIHLLLGIDAHVEARFRDARDAHDQIVDGLLRLMQRAAATEPLLLVVEDAHWIDPSTEAFLRELALRLDDAPIMLLIAKRPGWELPNSGLPFRTELTLNRVTREHAFDIAAANGGDLLDRPLVKAIVERSEGIPLYVEELTRAMVHSPDHQELPDSIQSLFVARLDSLGNDKQLAQVLSVLGRSFDRNFVKAVADEEDLEERLHRIEASGLILKRGRGASATYRFKHALIQETAYETLLHSTRRKVHSRIADVLLSEYTDLTGRQPEVAALHLARAGRDAEATHYYLMAGKRFAAQSAHIEAAEQYRGGLRSLAKAPQTSARDGDELDLRIGLGASLLMKEGWSAPDVAENYELALKLSRSGSDSTKLFVALRGQANVHFLKGELRKTRSIVEQLITMAEEDQNVELLIEAYRSNGMCSIHEAEFDRAIDYLTRANDLYDPVRHAHMKLTYGTDPGVIGLSGLSWANWFLGNRAKAEDCRDLAIALGNKLQHPFSLIYAEGFAACLAQFGRNPADAMKHADNVIAMAKEHDFPYWTGWGRILRGWAVAMQGEVESGLNELRGGIQLYRGTGAAQMLPYAEFLINDIQAECPAAILHQCYSDSDFFEMGRVSESSFFGKEPTFLK